MLYVCDIYGVCMYMSYVSMCGVCVYLLYVGMCGVCGVRAFMMFICVFVRGIHMVCDIFVCGVM